MGVESKELELEYGDECQVMNPTDNFKTWIRGIYRGFDPNAGEVVVELSDSRPSDLSKMHITVPGQVRSAPKPVKKEVPAKAVPPKRKDGDIVYHRLTLEPYIIIDALTFIKIGNNITCKTHDAYIVRGRDLEPYTIPVQEFVPKHKERICPTCAKRMGCREYKANKPEWCWEWVYSNTDDRDVPSGLDEE